MLIMPMDAAHLLPKECLALMKDPQLNIYYPREFEIDAAAGMKYIYSEPILPEIDDRLLITKMNQALKNKLNASEKKRNRLLKPSQSFTMVCNIE